MRSDLPIGLQAANLVHAAGESSPGNLSRGTYAVALHVHNQEELGIIISKLDSNGVSYVEIVESEGPFAGQAMAVGLTPLRDRSQVKKILSSLPLVKEVT